MATMPSKRCRFASGSKAGRREDYVELAIINKIRFCCASRNLGQGSTLARSFAELSRWLERPIGAQSSTIVMRPSRENAEAFEYGRKLIDRRGMTAEIACAETFKVHFVEIPVESLRRYHAKSIVPTAPSRPLYAPNGAR